MTAASEIFSKIAKTYQRHVWFPEPWTYNLVALFVIQTHIVESLNNVWYVAFIGPKGSGKTTALEVTSELSRNPALSNNMSAPSIARLAKGHTLCIDELDDLKGEALQIAEGVLRAGYRRGMTYIRCEGPKNVPVPYEVFGPKCYTLRNETEDALMSRTYGARTEMPHDTDVIRNMLIANALRDLSGLHKEIVEWADNDLVSGILPKLESLWSSDGFSNDLTRLIDAGALPRGVELAAACLSIAYVLGIDIVKDLDSAMSVQENYEDGYLEEFREEVYDLWKGMGSPTMVRRRELKESFNISRAERKEAAVGQKLFGRLLREAGARDGVELIKRPGGSRVIYFSPDFRRKITPQDSAQDNAQAEIPPTGFVAVGRNGHNDSSIDTHTTSSTPASGLGLYSAQEVRPASQSERFSAVSGICRELSRGGADFCYEDVRDRAALLAIANSEVLSIMNHMLRAGDIMEPVLGSGRYKSV